MGMSAGGLAELSGRGAVVGAAQEPVDPAFALAPERVAHPNTGVLTTAARTGADIVGDACVVWRVLPTGDLEPAATFHRDRRLRYALGSFVQQGPLVAGERWPGQVAATGAPVRARRIRLGALGVESAIGMRRAHALVVPVVVEGHTVAVIAALRGSTEPEYSLREELLLRRVAAKAGRGLVLESESGGGGDGPRDDDGRRGGGGDGGGDGDGAGRGDGPSDGPGWSPPPAWLIDHVGVGVWVADREGVTTYVNSAMTEMLGVPASDVVGRSMRDFVDDVPQMVGGEFCMDAERCDRRVTQPDGRHVWLEMTSRPLVDESGTRQGTVSTTIDVTARKQVELAARQRVPRAHRRH
jgi:PAS domain S-box-containing protein